MPLAAHRISPNRAREVRERVWALLAQRIGRGIICARCAATYQNMEDRCQAVGGEPCAAENIIAKLQETIEQEVVR